MITTESRVLFVRKKIKKYDPVQGRGSAHAASSVCPLMAPSLLFFMTTFASLHNALGREKKEPRHRVGPVRAEAIIQSGTTAGRLPDPGSLPATNCQGDWAAPLGGPGYFDSHNLHYYHLGNIGGTKKKDRSGARLYRYGLFKVDINNARSRPLMTIKLPITDAIIPFGTESLSAIMTFVFSSPGNPCINGKARYVGFPVNPGSAKVNNRRRTSLSVLQGRGMFQLISSPGFPMAWDHSKKSVQEFDFQTMQSRSLPVRLSPTEVPIYFDITKRRYYAWHFLDKNKQRGLIAYEGSGKIAGKLLFQPGDKLLQQKNFFAVARIQHTDNSILIIEPDRWSGSQGEKTYTLHIPREYPVSEASIKISFIKKLALVSGFSKNSRKKWRTVFVFDYQKSWQVSSLSAPSDQYIAYESISNNGQWVMAELRSLKMDTTTSLSLYSNQSRKWTNIRTTRRK